MRAARGEPVSAVAARSIAHVTGLPVADLPVL
jgi:hypothetical protein